MRPLGRIAFGGQGPDEHALNGYQNETQNRQDEHQLDQRKALPYNGLDYPATSHSTS
jgi:hypothetical protein